MADEAVIIELFNGGRPIRFGVQDAVPIPKGSLLELDADRRVIVGTNSGGAFVGVAAMEKVANDGSTSISGYTDGIFDMKSDGGSDSRGALMMLSTNPNIIETCDAGGLLTGAPVGNYLEAGTNAGTEAVRVNR